MIHRRLLCDRFLHRERKFKIEVDELEGKYNDWQTKLHPDLVHSKSQVMMNIPKEIWCLGGNVIKYPCFEKEVAGHKMLAVLGFDDEKAKELAKSMDTDIVLSFK
ncbi:unnamed protein product [Fraxinus pennsylvanica]|uniref:Uncharacterized protein n=1 Tax=Fraxinus pennsylvanica TaxID=56036 RepID=A0AAD1YYS1_9LAMI|nr:unnamed protein product [Fraxinus pennsylvanica]